MALVDDYTAWVVGNTAKENIKDIRSIVNKAMQWEKLSGATFEREKTAFIHFIRNSERRDQTPTMVKGKTVVPQTSAKILRVVMDEELSYK